jgi:Tol biopolymer transport system component
MGGKRQLVSLKENGTEITFLGDGEQPSWHPTENKFVFIRSVSSNNNLKAVYEMDLESAQVTEIYRDSNNYNCRNPSFSADGRYILFQKGAEVRTTGSSKNNKESVEIKQSKWQIFIMNADGSGLTTLTSGNVDAYCPSMDANGWMYFIANTGKTEIYRSRVSLE